MLNKDFGKAAEPSDIVWENRHFDYYQIKKRELCAYIGVGIVLALSFALIYALTI